MNNTIWFADDDPYYHDDIISFLESKEFDCRGFFTGTELLTEVINAAGGDHKLPDAIILDMMMPYDDSPEQQMLPPDQSEVTMYTGYRVLKELVKMGWDPSTVVCLTAYSLSVELWQPLFDLGIRREQLVIKPVAGFEIYRAVRAACKVR